MHNFFTVRDPNYRIGLQFRSVHSLRGALRSAVYVVTLVFGEKKYPLIISNKQMQGGRIVGSP